MALLADKLKSAFKNAFFLGYDQSRGFLREALDQVEPLTYGEQKAATFSLTYAQQKISLEREGVDISVLERQRLKAEEAFAADVTEAQGLAEAYGNAKVTVAIAAAKKAASLGF